MIYCQGSRWELLMNEQEWVDLITRKLKASFVGSSLLIEQGKMVPYAHEVLYYSATGKPYYRQRKYETDILISDIAADNTTKPRVIIEAKIKSVTTHEAITYSQKAFAHKHIHPYLRYGIILGKHHSLPGRLFRHGVHFDFMQSFVDFEPTAAEWENFLRIVKDEIENSFVLEDVILNTRSVKDKAFTSLQKGLDLRPKQTRELPIP
jgi:hypothetical protein